MIILIDTETEEKCRPAVDAIAWVIRDLIDESGKLGAVLTRNGWTVEMVAWAKVIGEMVDRYESVEVGPK